MKKSSPPLEPEFSWVLTTDRVTAKGLTKTLAATPQQRLDLALRLGLLELPKLQADLEVQLTPHNDLIKISGQVKADVVQQCVVTLEPLPSHITSKIEAIFAPESYQAEGAGMMDLSSEEDDIDYIIDGKIDLGELVTQHLGMALDPYPRQSGLPLVTASFGDKDPSSLIDLAGWKKNLRSNND